METSKNLYRCNCPITSAVDIVGDRWTLVIIKLMLIQFCHTFKDISQSEEGIAPNILSSRLKNMLSLELITKTHPSNNKKVNIYHLTEKGLSLIPIIYDLMVWSDTHLKEYHFITSPIDQTLISELSREEIILEIQKQYKASVALVLSDDY